MFCNPSVFNVYDLPAMSLPLLRAVPSPIDAAKPNMIDTGWVPIFIKMASTALAVTLASTVAEAFGPVWGALAASLPVSAGPVYIFLVLSNDAHFVADSALGSCAATAATILFLAVYVRLVGSGRGSIALPVAVAVWLGLACSIHAMGVTPLMALLMNATAFVAGLWLTRGTLLSEAGVAPLIRSRFDLPIRAGIVALFVAVVVGLSHALGPSATGTLAAFPIVFVVMIAVLRKRIGSNACAVLAATALKAMGGFALMLLVLALTVVPLGGAIALTLALATTLSWSASLIFINRRRGSS